MRTGDTVLHKPSGEKWSVAYVDGDELYWRGWPFGWAKASDCELLRACPDEEHERLLRDMAASDPKDRRCRYARLKLGLED